MSSENNYKVNSEQEGNNKSKILVIIEVILLLLVIILAIIFFAGRGQSKITLFSGNNGSGSVNNQSSQEENQNIQINNDINSTPQANVGDSASPAVSVPKSDNTQVVDSYRLSAPVPDQSPVSTESDVPEGAIRIEGLEDGFFPNEFRVAPGEEVTLALSSKIKYPVILTFYEESMPAISIGCGPYETRWVTFTAPDVSGEYTFRNDVFGKSDQTGKMIVE